MALTKMRIVTVCCLLFLLTAHKARAQDRLDKRISINVRQEALSRVLAAIALKGDFSFSYNTRIIDGDSLVSLKAEGSPVRDLLERLLGGGYEFVESGRYIIILQKAAPAQSRLFVVSGYVKDGPDGQGLGNVSVYESSQLLSALTDSSGFFRLRLRDRTTHVTLVISKQLYSDTLVMIKSGTDQQLSLWMSKARVAELSPFVVTGKVEKTWLGRLFLSSREVVQSVNLVDFFANKPIQFSFTPGLGTHGQMGAQVINKFSLNLIGGYTAGIDGLELAGVFNIDKKEVKYVQVAGVFNTVGGNVRGVQLAGVHNDDLDSMEGLQAGGIGNMVRAGMDGVQLAGVFNHVGGRVQGVQAGGIANLDRGVMKGVQLAGVVNDVKDSMQGIQVAGIINMNQGPVGGLQLAGIANYNKGTVRGVQVSYILNYAHHLRGVQLGLVNIADTSSGFMIGLVNIVKNGLHYFSLSADELLPMSISYKVGTRRIYSILQAGIAPGGSARAYGYAFGIGTELPLGRAATRTGPVVGKTAGTLAGTDAGPATGPEAGPVTGQDAGPATGPEAGTAAGKRTARRPLSLATEFYIRNIYLGSWEHMPTEYRLQASLQWRISPHFSMYAGPSISLCHLEPGGATAGYKQELPASGYGTFSLGQHGSGWVGFQAGINFN